MTRGPFIHSGRTTRHLLLQTLVALTPLGALACWRFPGEAPELLLSACLAACLTDAACRRAPPHLEGAAVTGVLFAFMLPVGAPCWLAAAGAAIAVGVGKHVFGGRRKNPFNPAALSRAVLMGLLPVHFFAPAWEVDGVTAATVLSKESGGVPPALEALLWGGHPGTLAEVGPLAVLAGGMLLILLRAIDWRVPLTYLSTLCFLALVLPGGGRVLGHAPWLVEVPAVQLIAGGGLFTAFFLLTDPVTSPYRIEGRVAFAALAGLFTMLVRLYTPYPDGAVLAVLAVNALVPRIDRWLDPELGGLPGG